MKLHAPAKINLNLKIMGRRNDGYHLLQSDMVFTTWGDEIEIIEAQKLKFTVDGLYKNIFDDALMSVDRDSRNLIIKAIYKMADIANKSPNFHVHLTKNIPAGAGIGGGSSDAATIINWLNIHWNMGMSFDELCVVGLKLGAELPVCIYAKPACVTGIGEIITPIDVEPMHILIVWSNQQLLTVDVFASLRGTKQSMDTNAVNDLTTSAISLCPQIGELITKLQNSNGCKMASMSGSGTACFGVFETEQQAIEASHNFKNSTVTKNI